MRAITHDRRREWRQRQQMAQGDYHPPLFLERAAAGARDAMVYVPHPPSVQDSALSSGAEQTAEVDKREQALREAS